LYCIEEKGVMVSPLLESKLRLPRLQSSLIFRKRLLNRLDAGLERKLTLISAPAGSGKTTVVRQWISARAGEGHDSEALRVAWIALDAGDNDLVQFWRYFITASQVFQPGTDRSAVLSWFSTIQQPPFAPAPLETILTVFLNELAHSDDDRLLVLEDYHAITEPRIHEMLTFVLDHLPPTFHIVLIARGDPPLPLIRLRAHNELCELHGADLRFSSEETQAFLQQELPFSLPAETIGHLATRLEGWPVGLRLLAFMLQGRESQREAEAFLVTFTGGQRPVLDYFVTEVLDTQPELIQRFLLSTSTLSRLTGSLCVAVTGNVESEMLLETLDQMHLFLEPLGGRGQWYRYHALFAEAMQHEALRRLDEAELRAVSFKASSWYEEHGMPEDAIEAALHAQDFTHAATMIEQLVDFNAPYLPALHRWLKVVPSDVLNQHPILCLSSAIAELIAHLTDRYLLENRALFEEPLGTAERIWLAEGNTARLGETFALRALFASGDHHEMPEAVNWARKALVCLPAKERGWRSTCIRILGLNAYREGHLHEAHHFLRDAYTLSDTIGNRPVARVTTLLLGNICAEQGELHQAEIYFQQVLIEARAQADPTDAGPAQLCLAQLAYDWNRLQVAEQQVQEIIERGAQIPVDGIEERALFQMVCIQYALGQRIQMQELLMPLLARLHAHHLQPVYRDVLLFQVRLQIADGDLIAAQHSYEKLVAERNTSSSELHPLEHRALPYTTTFVEQEEILQARLLLARREAQLALVLLQRLLPAAQEAGRTRPALEMQLLIVLAHAALKQVQEARQHLYLVLVQTWSEGYVRLFLDEGMPLLTLLRDLSASVRERSLLAYLQTILQAFAQEQGGLFFQLAPVSPSLLEPLSRQEQRVLRLLVAGRSNPEIARELVVSVNTIRTQVQSIYRKLGVSNRIAASEAARSLNLLS
jgi:LuxR family maltose regulon positive regulatory protein